MIHFDPPSLVQPAIGTHERACDGRPVGCDREHGATGVVSEVTCPECKQTKAFQEAAHVPVETPDETHWHRAGEPVWACGIRRGPATGEVDQVTCPECLALLPREDVPDEEEHADADAEVVSLPPAELPGEEPGAVLASGVAG